MLRPLFAGGTVRNLNVLVLATLLAVTAFAAGRAGAARDGGARRRTQVVDVVQHAAPAVVSVFAEKRSSRNMWIQSAGAGVLVHPAGFVVTNSHVIKGGSTFRVQLWGDGGSYRAQVVANLPGNDLALLRIQRSRPFPYVSIAHSGGALLGESVIAIGNPRGLGDTITVGVVSALDNLIQTDASINSGNSGGALLNLDGELLGVVVSIMPRCNGIAFAIPGEQVKQLLQRALGQAPARKPLPETPTTSAPSSRPPGIVSSTRTHGGTLPPPSVGRGSVAPRSLGRSRAGRTSGMKTSPMRPEDFGMSLRNTGDYLQVTRVERSSAADRAGVRTGDVVLAIDGEAVGNELDLVMAFSAARPGQSYQLHVRRAGEERHAALLVPRAK
ncbi:MAG: trypsin-like peptidase domain-containing protein [Planctomycetota bacterium]|nr:trypsin-like peptidase domain-containing protein [Planctomycetota bacterium]